MLVTLPFAVDLPYVTTLGRYVFTTKKGGSTSIAGEAHRLVHKGRAVVLVGLSGDYVVGKCGSGQATKHFQERRSINEGVEGLQRTGYGT
jgi:hypothetical protein